VQFRPFAEAREFVQSLGLKNQQDWRKYCKSGKKPKDIPSNAHTAYKNEWIGYGDWLGTGRKATQDIEFRPFAEAREFVHKLKLKNQDEWRQYIKSGRKPSDIPNYPEGVYKNEWKGHGDWLGTGVPRIANQDKEFLPFIEARKFIHKLKLKNQDEWRQYIKSGRKPQDIPSHPDRTYEHYWKGWGDWLGTYYIAAAKREYVPFEEARNFVHSPGLKSLDEWKDYCKSYKKPADIPVYPDTASSYKEKWKGWKDWLGYTEIQSHLKTYLAFDDAKEFVHSLGFKNRDDWLTYAKTGKKPANIPADPSKRYKEWRGWGDWLGTGTIAPKNRQFRPFNEARQFVNRLGIGSWSKWISYCNSGDKPEDIPSNPDKYYEKDWIGWGDWLGTGTIGPHDRVYRPFKEARKYIRSLGLKNQAEWNSYCKSGRKPQDIPSHPSNKYNKDWIGWGDWLGTGTIGPHDRVYRPFKDAREFVQSIGIKNMEEWKNYCRSGNKPEDIPANPVAVYEREWTWWADWLGYEEKHWTVRKVKELLKDLIESNIISGWDEAVLYSFLLRKGF
jgi:Phage-integrase repeat unit